MMAAETGVLLEEPPRRTEDPPSAPAAAQPEGAGEPAVSDKSAKGKESKGAGSKSSKSAPDASGAPSVAAHPRAARSVARAKGWGGLAGFLIAGYLSLPTGTLAEAALRALVAGSVCYVVAWASAVFVWRRLVVLEIKSREQQLFLATQTGDERLEPSVASAERSSSRAV